MSIGQMKDLGCSFCYILAFAWDVKPESFWFWLRWSCSWKYYLSVL